MFTSIKTYNEAISNNIITAYHGSKTEITNFVTDFVGGKDALDQNGPGIYFTSHEEDAAKYGNHVYKVTLNPKRLLTESPFKMSDKPKLIKLAKMREDWKMYANDWDINPNIGLNKMVNDAIEYNDNEIEVWLQIWYDMYRNSGKQYVDNMTKLGIDGLKIKGYNNDESIFTHYIIYNTDIISNKEKIQ